MVEPRKTQKNTKHIIVLGLNAHFHRLNTDLLPFPPPSEIPPVHTSKTNTSGVSDIQSLQEPRTTKNSRDGTKPNPRPSKKTRVSHEPYRLYPGGLPRQPRPGAAGKRRGAVLSAVGPHQRVRPGGRCPCRRQASPRERRRARVRGGAGDRGAFRGEPTAKRRETGTERGSANAATNKKCAFLLELCVVRLYMSSLYLCFTVCGAKWRQKLHRLVALVLLCPCCVVRLCRHPHGMDLPSIYAVY